jgi:hypothetical protein
MPLVAEAPDVELQALQLDAELVGDVIEHQHREIRLPGLGTEAGEFRNFHVNQVVPCGSGLAKVSRAFRRVWMAGMACCMVAGRRGEDRL